MAMTLRLSPEETEALRARAQEEGKSMQEVARTAIVSYIEDASRKQIIDHVLDRELGRYADAIERLGR